MQEWKKLQEEFELEANDVTNWLDDEYTRIRSGRVSLNILDIVKIEAYGEMMSLNQIANLQIVDARQILIKPYDRGQIHDIAKAITASQLNVNPQVNADNIRLIFPAQTEENRRQNTKKAKEILEIAKTKLRNVRKNIQDQYKKVKDTVSEDLIRFFEEELNKITKTYNNKLEDIYNKKEQELMRI
ncbi:MAG: ribosome recycling factor [Mycoplasmataceae bacterium]|nr:ribosome recycling factor [Mycoplasmataceae bacterium]